MNILEYCLLTCCIARTNEIQKVFSLRKLIIPFLQTPCRGFPDLFRIPICECIDDVSVIHVIYTFDIAEQIFGKHLKI